MKLDLSKIENVYIDGIDYGDYPDFCDAYLESGEINGRELTDEEIEFVNEECPEWVYEMLDKQLH